MLVVCWVCDGVNVDCGVCESVGRRVMAWWIEKRKGWSERHGHTKAKRRSFPSNHFPPSFPFFFFFPTLSFPDSLLLRYHPLYHPLSMSKTTSFQCATYVHIHDEHKLKPTQHQLVSSYFSHVHFLFCYIFSKPFIFFDHYSLQTMRYASNRIYSSFISYNIACHTYHTSNGITQTVVNKKNGSIEISQN